MRLSIALCICRSHYAFVDREAIYRFAVKMRIDSGFPDTGELKNTTGEYPKKGGFHELLFALHSRRD
jgi:hypothetical protein